MTTTILSSFAADAAAVIRGEWRRGRHSRRNASRPSFVIAAALAICAVSAHAETVQIASAADWATFANRVNNGASALCAEMTADVTLGPDAPRAGTDTHRWSGTFDGGGHTLTVDWTFADETSHVAPFAYVDGCEIHDLRVAGSIVTAEKMASGFVGQAMPNGNVTIERCVSSVAITCTMSGDATCAGFVGCTDYGRVYTIYLTDCLFDGSLLGQNASCFGGFVGQKFDVASVRLSKCVFAPTAVEVSDYDSFTFVRNGSSCDYSTCYRTRTIGAVQGNDASAMSAEDLAAALGRNWTVANGKAMLAEFAVPTSPPEPMHAGFAYQGLLRDAQGNALSPGERSKTVEFRLYSQASGGEPLWGRSQPVLLDEEGLFVVEISDAAGTALGDAASTNLASVLASGAGSSLYLGLTVADGPDAAEIAPRQRLVPVPFATIASDATGASGDFAVAGAATAGGATVSGLLDARSLSVSGGATASSVAVAGSVVSGDGTIPLGGIIPWSGATSAVPDGWALCNGQTVNGRKTPDLRDRFVVGAGGDYQPNATGGVARVTLTVEQMPAHTHDYKFTGADLALSWDNDNYFYDASREYPNNTNTKTTESRGGNQPHENRPPYYALCYIMRVR